jgi:two-component system, OmpR family, sensor histidine kinase KdpD
LCGSSHKKSIRYNLGVDPTETPAPGKLGDVWLRPAKRLTFRYAATLGALAFLVWVYIHLLVNPTTVALSFLLVVLFVASRWGLTIAITISVVATLAFNYYFLPPVHTFTIVDPQNWIALLAFLVSAILASRLSERARRETENANRRRKEVERLYSLSQQLLSTENFLELNNSIPLFVREAFRLTEAAMFLPKRNEVYRTGIEHPELSDDELRAVSVRGELLIKPEQCISIVPLRIGARPVGSLGLEGCALSRETLEAVGSLIAISIERAGAVETLSRTEAARESEKLRSAILDSVTHEFRTPLTSIKASVSTLLSSANIDDAGRHDLLAVIDEETDRLNHLVGEAAEMAQLDAQQVELHLEPCRAMDIVEAALAKSCPALGKHELRKQIPEQLPEVRVDLERIAEVLNHLLENAAKYSQDGTPITVSAEIRGRMVEISVADRGPGIDDLEQSLVFEKFYRGRDQRYRIQGTGMGLAISKAIVEAHGGTISLTSQLGSGSVFRFTVPVS